MIKRKKMITKEGLLNKNILYFGGINGIQSLYKIIINSWKPKDEYYIASAPLESFKKLESFFVNIVHKKRIKDKVVMKILINRAAESYSFVRKNMPHTQVRFLDIDTEMEYGVLNDLLFLVSYGNKPYGLLIKGSSSADTFRNFFKILWNHGRRINIPPLIFMNKTLSEILGKFKTKNPMIVADTFNYNLSKKFGDSFCVENNLYSNVEQVRKKMSTNKNPIVIGIGGCAALDVARACATPDVPAILIPTILSTVCISVDKSVFVCKGGTKTFQTESPHKIILSLKVLLNTKKEDLIKWSQSGFGDLFAKTGASIDVVFRKTKRTNDKLSLEKVRRNIPETFEAMDWVLNHFKEYNKKNLEALAVFLHEASVAIIILGGFELSGGAEHDLAYALDKRYKQSMNKWPTHGQLVSMGTLIELNLFGKITGDYSLYERMVRIYKKVGLPTDYKSLENLGIKKEFIIQGIKDIAHLNTFMSHYSKKAISLLDKIFKRSGANNE